MLGTFVVCSAHAGRSDSAVHWDVMSSGPDLGQANIFLVMSTVLPEHSEFIFTVDHTVVSLRCRYSVADTVYLRKLAFCNVTPFTVVTTDTLSLRRTAVSAGARRVVH